MNAQDPKAAVAAMFADGVRRFHWMGSPLYAAFSERILKEESLLALAAEAPHRQPATHLFLAAVQMLVLEDPNTPLGAFYGSVTDRPDPDPDRAFAAFRDFCAERRDAILAIMKSRTLQFTFAGRAGFILPNVAYVATLAGEPLSLIDIGCSAGLLTGFDKYAYDFGPDGRFGDPAEFTITSFRFVGGKPAFLTGIPRIRERIGIDLNPVDARDPTERHWIDALCPPDMVEERRQLRGALDFRARNPFPIVKDDALKVLPDILAKMPDPVCILATHCLYQWPQAARDALDALLCQASVGRTLHRIAIDHPGALDPARGTPSWNRTEDEAPMEHESVLTVYCDGTASSRLVGRYDSYGRRGIWLGQDLKKAA